MMNIPIFMKPLLETYVSFGKASMYVSDLVGLRGDIKIEYDTTVISNILTEQMEMGKYRTFQHETKLIFYVSIYPRWQIRPRRATYFDCLPHKHQISLKANKKIAKKFTLLTYKPRLLSVINSINTFQRDSAGFTKPDAIFPLRPTERELEGKLYGPYNIDEMMTHMKSKFSTI